MLKNNFFVILFLFMFSCSIFWKDDNSKIDWLVLKEKPNFSIEVPSSWEIIENKESILPKPNRWKIELAVTSKKEKLWFKNNLLILSDDLWIFTSSKEFSMLNNVWASKDYIDYKLIESKNFNFIDEEESVLYIFEAKYNLDTPKLKFLQTSHICNQNKAFFFTIAIPTSTKDTSKYEELLKTFKCG